MQLFPYEPRLHQPELVGFLADLARAGAHGVVESGTGTGKTVCALAGLLPASLGQGKRILYLTRTNSQQRQVVLEFRRIRERHLVDATCVALQGRTHLCPLRKEDDELQKANAEELAVMCRDRCRAVDLERAGERPPANVTPCRFYRRSDPPNLGPLVTWAKENVPTAEELVAEAGRRGVCPYETTKALLTEAKLVVAPYVYLFHPGLRRAFLQWTNAKLEDFLVVVDEAHNLPDYARDLASADLTRTTLARARDEALRHGNVELGATRLIPFLNSLDGIVTRFGEELIRPGEEDALLPPDWLETELLSLFATSTVGLRKHVGTLVEYAEAVREERRREGRVPRSYVGAVARFLTLHLEADERFARLVARDSEEGAARLECYALDPSEVTRVVLSCSASVHMSGTLRPLDAYRDTVGLPENTPLRLVPSPFPPENRLVLVDPEVTTRWEELKRAPDMWQRFGERLLAIRAATDRNVMVFAPSYEVLRRLAPWLPGATFEEPGLPQEELMRRVGAFKSARGATFACVLGGRVAEGLDFPADELEVAVVVGLPYPKPTARQRALERYYDRLLWGRGFEVASKAPMMRRTLQAAGRVVRTPTDRGVVVLLDKRAVLLSDEIDGIRVERDCAGAVGAFFAG